MTNEPGFRMVLEKLKQQFEAFLKVFNVTLGSQPQPRRAYSAAAPVNASAFTLEIGNELLITDEIVKAYQGLSNARGRVVIIDQVPSHDSHGVKASAFGIQVDVDMEEALEMREAYMAWQQS